MDALLIPIVMILMMLALFLVVIPVVPVAAVEWAIAMVFGALTSFERLTLPAVSVMTVFMVLGSTSQYWAPFLGLKGKQMSCLGILAFFVGAIIGTGVIPIPILGTLIGGLVAVMIVEFINTQDWRQALIGGKAALKTFVVGLVMEFIFSALIVATMIISLASSA
jgi:uncharacterized protein YqgC (DUF456 family)